MRLLRKPSSRLITRACLAWTMLVVVHLAWRVRELITFKPAPLPTAESQDLLLITFGFTHLPYWLAGIVVLMVLQFLLFRRSLDNALKLQGRESFDSR